MGMLLPLLCFGLLFLLARRIGVEHRRAVLAAAVGWGVLVTVITEFLSLANLLTPGFVVLAWTIAIAVTGAIAIGLSSRTSRNRLAPANTWHLPPAERAIVIAMAILSIAIAMIGVASAPTNWDSMTYHLVRVMHWMQNRSVAHYPASSTAQLYQGPWAEFVMLHLQLLSGSDRWAFIVQWASMVLSLIAVSVLAEELGTRTGGQILAAAFAFTLPNGVLQANSTQNAYVVTAWLAVAAVTLFSFRRFVHADNGRVRWGGGRLSRRCCSAPRWDWPCLQRETRISLHFHLSSGLQ